MGVNNLGHCHPISEVPDLLHLWPASGQENAHSVRRIWGYVQSEDSGALTVCSMAFLRNVITSTMIWKWELFGWFWIVIDLCKKVTICH